MGFEEDQATKKAVTPDEFLEIKKQEALAAGVPAEVVNLAITKTIEEEFGWRERRILKAATECGHLATEASNI